MNKLGISLSDSTPDWLFVSTVVASSACVLGSIYYTFSPSRRRRRELALIAERARFIRDRDRDEVHLTAPIIAVDEITNLSAGQLAEKIRNGHVSAVDVVTTACIRSRSLGRSTNCCTEQNYVEAMLDAAGIDRARSSGEALPKLAGVPFSVKDMIDMKGFSSTSGLIAHALKPSERDCPLVAVLRKNGAIPIVKSATPQALLLPETDSRLWGKALNPWNPDRTPGGSSGGESALISARVTYFGIGTDIGGSIRIPAMFCGIVGYKPTPQRMGMAGIPSPRVCPESIIPTVGPMTRTVDDAELIMSCWLGEDSELWKHNPYTPRIPWRPRSEISRKKIRVGYFENDGWFLPAPACRRAVRDAIDGLKKCDDVECVAFDPVEITEVVRCYYALLSSDGNFRSIMEAHQGEEIHPSYRKLQGMAMVPSILRKPICYILRMLKWNRIAAIIEIAAGKSAWQYWKWVLERKRLQKKWVEAMKKDEIDALVVPGLALPAFLHGGAADLTPACSYTFLFNLLHWPAGTLPVTSVREDETDYVDEDTPDSEPWFKAAQKNCRDSQGLPVGVQVATLPFQDELCLEVMRKIEKAVGFNASPGIIIGAEACRWE